MSRIKIIEESSLRPMIENIVERKLIELFGDPDMGLALTDKIKKRLSRSFKSKLKGIPAEKAASRLGLKW